MRLLTFLGLVPVVMASTGDQLPRFTHCLQNCVTEMGCGGPMSESTMVNLYSSELSNPEYSLNPLASLFWNCQDDCSYRCQQIISDAREASNKAMVQFYGKWPFKRIFGIQEFYSVLFSLGNFYVNYRSLFTVLYQYNKNKKDPNPIYRQINYQYLLLILGSLFGWTFSSIFHFRDNRFTETLDYFGAFAIILLNFNAISYRFLELFNLPLVWQGAWKIGLVLMYLFHVTKMKLNWDYNYNTTVNMLFGICAMVMWMVHSFNIFRLYRKNYVVYNNSIQLLPFETRLLHKLNYLFISKASIIPLIPIFLNIWLMGGIMFEVVEFTPKYRLIDGHSIWHFFTIFPSIIWYDWNIWDIELLKITNDLQKHV